MCLSNGAGRSGYNGNASGLAKLCSEVQCLTVKEPLNPEP